MLLLTCRLDNSVTAFAHVKVKVNSTGGVKESGDPLIAATVKATLSNGTEQTFSITNAKGLFNIDLSRPGSYDLEFSYIGYKKVNKTVNIRPGDKTFGRTRMTEETIEIKGTDIIGKNRR